MEQVAGWAPWSVWMDAEIIAPNVMRSPVRPTRSESLYRLSYPGPELRSAYRNTAEVCFVLQSVTKFSRHTCNKSGQQQQQKQKNNKIQNNNHNNNVPYSGFKPTIQLISFIQTLQKARQ
jgi:hypothetical protein